MKLLLEKTRTRNTYKYIQVYIIITSIYIHKHPHTAHPKCTWIQGITYRCIQLRTFQISQDDCPLQTTVGHKIRHPEIQEMLATWRGSFSNLGINLQIDPAKMLLHWFLLSVTLNMFEQQVWDSVWDTLPGLQEVHLETSGRIKAAMIDNAATAMPGLSKHEFLNQKCQIKDQWQLWQKLPKIQEK